MMIINGVKKLAQCFVVISALLAGSFPVAGALRGDVNLDNRVDLNDVTEFIDYLLDCSWTDDGSPMPSPGDNDETFSHENADTDFDGGLTPGDLTDLIDFLLDGQWPFNPVEHQVFTLLHLSDSHGFAVALNQALAELNQDPSIDAMLFTGDWTGHAIYNNTIGQQTYALTTPEVDSAFMAIKHSHGDKLLMLTGNHDAYDNNPNLTARGSQRRATAMLKQWMTEGAVQWGDASGVASYWHRDYPLDGGSKLRIVTLDQYENSVVGKPSGQFNYKPIYSQAQVDWLVERLKELTPDDYLIIALHEPAYQDDADIPALKPTMDEDSTLYNNEPDRLFVSEKLTTFNYKGDTSAMSINLLPRIMHAYLHSSRLAAADGGTVYYRNLDVHQTLIPVNADFTGCTPAHFLFYIGGHRHCDICTPLPAPFDNQLMIHVAAADWTVASGHDDDLLAHAQVNFKNIPTSNDANVKACVDDPDYRINKVTLDFTDGIISIERIGACHTAGGRVRSTISWPMARYR